MFFYRPHEGFYDSMIELIRPFVHEDRSICVSTDQLLFRGVNIKPGTQIENHPGRNLWVCQHIEGAKRYSKAFDQSNQGNPVILEFKPVREISLLGLHLFGITQSLFNNQIFKGLPQIYQRDNLLLFLEEILSRQVDGFYDFGAEEILVKADLVRLNQILR